MTSKTVSALAVAALVGLSPVLGRAAYAQEAIPAAPLSAYDVNAIDRSLMFPYSGRMDGVSDYTQYAAFLAPAMFAAAAPVEDWLGIGLMYATSTALSFGTRTILKATIDRDRPYMYFAGPPGDALADGDYRDSFPSGHSIMAFTGAGFTAALFGLRYPDSKYRLPVTLAAYALAGATVALRVGSGSHFITDVAAGAAIGSLFGFIVPFAADRLGLLD